MPYPQPAKRDCIVNSTESIYDVSNHWISCPKPNSEALVRLFFFPYAGAGSTTYHTWSRFFSPEIELYLVHLPGRDKRISETPFTRLAPLVESLTHALFQHLDKPFSFFGHSMGGLVGFEVVRQLHRQYSLLPVHLFVSGRLAPHLPDTRRKLHELPEGEFLRATEERYGALPEAVSRDRELLQLFLSILRADITLIETYQYIDQPPLECPISVFGGLQDHTLTRDELAAWRDQTETRFDLKMFPGDHFFIQSSKMDIAQAINEDLEKSLSTQL
jgi:medium-chain acyl-[acyl-carrier-protein] hydrolase